MSCRAAKCIALGMSRTKSRFGRYSAETARDAQLQKRRSSTSDTSISSSSSPPTNDSEQEKIITELTRLSLELLRVRWIDATVVRREVNRPYPEREKQFIRYEAENMALCTKALITFAKGIPGWRDIPLSDQVNLVKNNHREFIFMAANFTTDEAQETVYVNGHRAMHKIQLDVLDHNDPLQPVASRLLELIGKIQQMHLTSEERALIAAVCLLTTDRCTLQYREKIDKMRIEMISCLQTVLDRTRNDSRKTMNRLLEMLREFRPVADRIGEVDYENMHRYADLDIPDVMRELWERDTWKELDRINEPRKPIDGERPLILIEEKTIKRIFELSRDLYNKTGGAEEAKEITTLISPLIPRSLTSFLIDEFEEPA